MHAASAPRRLLCALALLLAAVALAGPGVARAQAAPGPVYTVSVGGPLTPAAAAFLRRALREAEAAGATALVIELGGGGAVLGEARSLGADIVRAKVPVVVYITPPGASSGAAGALLLSAAHVAAMAPGTSFGGAAPLAAAGPALTQQSQGMVADSVADQLREWNRARGRSVAWVERAVQSGAIVTNEQAAALTPPAVDLVAADEGQLLTLLEGRTVALEGGGQARIATLGRATVAVAPTALERGWQLLADPNAVFALLVLGALAIALEFAAPGTTLFAGVGAVLLLGAAVGLASLPVQWWALALVAVALGLLALEFVVASHGGLTVAGLVLLAVGGLNLVDQAQAPGAGVASWAVAVVVLGLAGVAGAGLYLALRVRSRPAATGAEALVGRLAEVRRRLDEQGGAQGMVFIDGALWQAVSEGGPAEPGEWVRVVGVHRLRLIVRPVDQEPAEVA